MRSKGAVGHEVFCVEGAEEVILIVDDAPPCFVGEGYEGKSPGKLRDALEDNSVRVVGRLLHGKLVDMVEWSSHLHFARGRQLGLGG